MTSAVALAGAAGCLGVWAAWEGIAAVEQASVARLLAPLAAARRRGQAPTTAERRRLAMVAAGCLLAGGWLLMGPVVGVALAAGGPLGVTRLLAARRARWRAALAAGAAPAARALADALAGGHAVRGAIFEAGRGLDGAAGEELRACAAALRLGERTETVLARLRSRARDPGWDSIVAAIALQRASGGDLASLLRELARSFEERRRIEADARAATAQARLTARIVAALPAGGAALAELARPGALSALVASAPATALTTAAVVCEGLGLLAVRAIVKGAERR